MFSQLLFPTWHNSIQKPFSLVWSLLNNDEDEEVTEKSADCPLVWKYPSKNLISKVEEMECGLRLILPGIMNRYRILQSGFIDKKNEILKAVSGDVLVQMDELVSVFLDSNRLRSILTEIISDTYVYQSAFYLQGLFIFKDFLSQFFLGFSDVELVK
ncbi:hypothetical protein MKW92_014529 [Papaver armeniacum]|nr:hypothetical protein MKW92_014529 [Papaver armeniacum]